MFLQDNPLRSPTAIEPVCSIRDVTYSCGSCGYPLNLSSSNRNTTNITSSKYGKSIKKGVVSFFSIDESRFSQSDEIRCLPYFTSKHSWGLFCRRTRLLCRKCGNYIGHGYDDGAPPAGSGASGSINWNGVAGSRRYDIRIRALQPCSDDSGISLLT